VMRICLYPLMAFGFLTPAIAQNLEVGGSAGFGFYRSVAISGPTGSGSAAFGPRFVLGAVAGKSFAEHLAIEGRYTYQDGDLQILGRGEEATSTAILPRSWLNWSTPCLGGTRRYGRISRRAAGSGCIGGRRVPRRTSRSRIWRFYITPPRPWR